MKTIQFVIAVTVAFLLTSCNEDQSNVQNSQVSATASSISTDDDKDAFTPNYISAKDLNARFESNDLPMIFDVRSPHSYEKSHITTALSVPYGTIEPANLSKIKELSINSEIVTYCGCPRHLSTLVAEDLTVLGYKNVKVLYDGYFYWQEQQYPTVENETVTTTLLQFEGVATASGTAHSGVDVFLRHAKSGQLEAARTDDKGQFQFDFHLYDYQSADEFELHLTNIDHQPISLLTADANTRNKLEIRL